MSGLPEGIRRVYSDADGLLMDQKNLPVGWTSNGIDRFVAIVETDPVTGRIKNFCTAGVDPMAELGIKLFQEGTAWKKIKSTFMALSQGAVAQPVMLIFGDSVAQYVVGYCSETLKKQFNAAGYGLGSVITYGTPTGAVADVTGDYTYWPNGQHKTVGSAGVLTLGPISGQLFVGTVFHTFLVNSPSGGSVTVDLIDGANAVIQTQTVATTGAVSLRTVTFTTGSATVARLRITGVSGTTPVVGAAAWNALVAGVVICDISVGGLALTSSNAVTNPSILSGVMAVLQPALCTYSMREVSNDAQHLADPASWITDATYGVQAMINKFSAGFVSEWLLIAPTPAAIDLGKSQSSAPSYIEGQALRAVADAGGHAFFDSWNALGGSWEAIVDRGNSGNDGIHIGAVEQQILAEAFYAETKFGLWAGTKFDRDIRSGNVSAQKLYLLKDVYTPAGGANLGTSGGGEDIWANVTRWMDIRHASGLQRAARFSTGGGADGGYGAIFASDTGFCSNVNYYERDGDYSVVVHPTTGVAKIYARVSGVLKSLTIGTLA